MIKTIVAATPEDLDLAVNSFERAQTTPAGLSRVFATQTHVHIDQYGSNHDKFIAVIFYREAKE